MSGDRIVVTATGIITALGTGREAHVRSIKQGISVLRHPEILNTKHAAEFVVGEVPFDNMSLSGRLALPEHELTHTRTALLSMCAMQDLAATADLPWLQRLGSKLAFVNANTVGGMSEIETLYPRFLSENPTLEEARWIDALDCAESTEQVALHFGLRPSMATVSTACSSSANAIIVAARMLKLGLAEAAIAGGGDALSRFTLNGFNSLKNVDRNACRPFDNERNGLNLGEGAAYVALELESTARKRGAKIEAVLSGWCNANDAYHPTAPSPDGSGALRTMSKALEMSGLRTSDIDYINTHGTATINNDLSEGLAIQTLWQGQKTPDFSSTKPFTGHTLAGAGVVEAIFSIWAMQDGFVPENKNWRTPMAELSIQPATSGITKEIRNVMSNSFGFGGNNATLIFSKA